MTARDIISLLAKRHEEDVFVPECKDGPSQTGNHMRMDAWAMRRSWAHPGVTAYEVKVSRADFIGDNKWPGYLRCCNQFYFVCPSGLIHPSEVPNDVGLLWVAGESGRLVTKQKAHYRHVQIPESVWRYILMCRTRITPPRTFMSEDKPNAEYWKEWLEQKAENRRLGYKVSTAITDHVSRVEHENRELKRQHERYDDVIKVLDELGYRPEDRDWVSGLHLRRKVERLSEVIPPHVVQSLQTLEASIKAVRATLAQETGRPV